MVKGPLKFLALLALAVGALFAVPAIATASTTSYVTPGAFCAKHHAIGQAKDGHLYVCAHDGDYWRWLPYNPAPSGPPTVAPSSITSAVTSPTSSPADPATSPANAGKLPVTGARTDLMIGGGGAAVLLGVGGVLLARRRRARFEA